MSKKHRPFAKIAPEELRQRVIRALDAGKTQTALDLARTNFKQDRSPENLQLLQRATLERARQLRSEGRTRDATTVLQNALDMGDKAFTDQVAEELAKCGRAAEALELLDDAGNDGVRKEIYIAAADAAVREGPDGFKNLPPTLHKDLRSVLQAFNDLEKGEDDAVRAALQEVGLTSPFLEWKLLIRGLLAYYANDDARALENWSRLDSNRLAFRMAAPYRAAIDKGFREAQPPAAQKQLREAIEKLQGASLIPFLRRLQGMLRAEGQMPEAFRVINQHLPLIKQQAPQLLGRFINCIYWAVAENGMPDDLDRFVQTFGQPDDDPNLHRLEAIATEGRGMMSESNDAWKQYVEELERYPAWRGAPQVKKAQALIWSHMGNNGAASVLGRKMPKMFRDAMPELNERMKPPPETCFRNSLKLDPELLEAHEGLFRLLRLEGKRTQAINAGKALIKRFPNNVEILEELAAVHAEDAEHENAVELLRQALEHNPLERRLRQKLATANLELARACARKRKYDEARAAFAAALGIDEASRKHAIATAQALCELKSGDDARAGELIEQAKSLTSEPLDVLYLAAAEGAWLELPAKTRARLTKEFEAALKSTPPAGATAAALLASVACYDEPGYVGFKSHLQKIQRYAGQSIKLPVSEADLESICEHMHRLKCKNHFRKAFKLGQLHYPKNPAFLLYEAEGLLAERDHANYRVPMLVTDARRLLESLPPGDRKQEFQEKAQALEMMHKLKELQSPFGFFSSMFGGGFGGFDDEPDDDDEFF